jgi:hypothetical protein
LVHPGVFNGVGVEDGKVTFGMRRISWRGASCKGISTGTSMGGNGGADVLGLLRGTDVPDGLVPLEVSTEESSKSPLRDLVIIEVGKLEKFSDGDGLPEVGVEQVRHGKLAQ